MKMKNVAKGEDNEEKDIIVIKIKGKTYTATILVSGSTIN